MTERTPSATETCGREAPVQDRRDESYRYPREQSGGLLLDATAGVGTLPLLRPGYCSHKVGSTVYNGSVWD